MKSVELRLTGAKVLTGAALEDRPVTVAEGLIADGPAREVDLAGWWLLPGIVDAHGDGFERHVAPRRGAAPDMAAGLHMLGVELAAAGITTANLAQFWSWEGGMRAPEFAERLADALARWDGPVDLRLHLRVETHLVDEMDRMLALVDRAGVTSVAFGDHLPHRDVHRAEPPPRLVRAALRSARSPEAHWARIRATAAAPDVAGVLARTAAALTARGVVTMMHDEPSPEARAAHRALGIRVAEFPETLATAEAAAAAGDGVVMGAPNVVRGSSHAGKVAAREVIAAGACDALASDYHHPACAAAALSLGPAGWRLVSEGPARMLGLPDRGRIAEGLRADLVAVDPARGRVELALARGRVAFASDRAAARLLA